MRNYAHEPFRAVDDRDTNYVPIGSGSGICGVTSMRDEMVCSFVMSMNRSSPETRFVLHGTRNPYGRVFSPSEGKTICHRRCHASGSRTGRAKNSAGPIQMRPPRTNKSKGLQKRI